MRFELLSRSPRPLCRRRYDRKELHRRSAFYEDCFGQSNCVRRSNWFGLPRQSPTTNMRMAPVSRARNFSYAETNPINLCGANFPAVLEGGAPATPEGLGLAELAPPTARVRQSRRFVSQSKSRSEERRVGKECRSRWSPS